MLGWARDSRRAGRWPSSGTPVCRNRTEGRSCRRTRPAGAAARRRVGVRPSTVVTVVPSTSRGEIGAGADRPAVDQHRTCATYLHLAAELRAGETQLVAQELDQSSAGRGCAWSPARRYRRRDGGVRVERVGRAVGSGRPATGPVGRRRPRRRSGPSVVSVVMRPPSIVADIGGAVHDRRAGRTGRARHADGIDRAPGDHAVHMPLVARRPGHIGDVVDLAGRSRRRRPPRRASRARRRTETSPAAPTSPRRTPSLGGPAATATVGRSDVRNFR